MFTDVECQRTRYVVSHGFFKKGEIADLCVLQLRQDSELTTRDLAERVMCARGLDPKDATLRNSVVFKVVQSLRHAARRIPTMPRPVSVPLPTASSITTG